MFANSDLDAIIIGSPTSTHVDLISRAMAQGVAALCEKPIDLDMGRVRACRDADPRHQNAADAWVQQAL